MLVVTVVDAERLPQLELTLSSRLLHDRPPCSDSVADAAGLTGEPLRCPFRSRRADPAYDEHANDRAERDVEETSHVAPRRAALAAALSAFICSLIRLRISSSFLPLIARRTP